MLSFQTSRLWKAALGPQTKGDAYEAPRRRLREAFLRFGEKAAVLAGEIARDLPCRTVHDISHLDALWGIADLISGEEIVLMPHEDCVLGGALLVHDLAMSRASYPTGLDSLRGQSIWRDAGAALLRGRLGRTPNDREID